MNDLVLLCLIFFIFVRIIGLGVSIDFFYNTKDLSTLCTMIEKYTSVISNTT